MMLLAAACCCCCCGLLLLWMLVEWFQVGCGVVSDQKMPLPLPLTLPLLLLLLLLRYCSVPTAAAAAAAVGKDLSPGSPRVCGGEPKRPDECAGVKNAKGANRTVNRDQNGQAKRSRNRLANRRAEQGTLLRAQSKN
jgi:hypothetical protein